MIKGISNFFFQINHVFAPFFHATNHVSASSTHSNLIWFDILTNYHNEMIQLWWFPKISSFPNHPVCLDHVLSSSFSSSSSKTNLFFFYFLSVNYRAQTFSNWTPFSPVFIRIAPFHPPNIKIFDFYSFKTEIFSVSGPVLRCFSSRYNFLLNESESQCLWCGGKQNWNPTVPPVDATSGSRYFTPTIILIWISKLKRCLIAPQ